MTHELVDSSVIKGMVYLHCLTLLYGKVKPAMHFKHLSDSKTKNANNKVQVT